MHCVICGGYDFSRMGAEVEIDACWIFNCVRPSVGFVQALQDEPELLFVKKVGADRKKPARWRAESISEETWRRLDQYKPWTNSRNLFFVSGC
jgi:hypothetical protein